MRSACPHVASTEPLEPRRLLTTWYVDAGSTAAAPDGSSWAAAYPDLQLALAAATSGDIVRIAGGTYKPTDTADHSVAFRLPSGVSLYGGYAGSSSPATPDARNVSLYPAVLSGDIGAPGSNADNSLHLLIASSPAPGTTLDGLTFTAANASPYSNTNRGGALSCTGGTLAIANCSFTSNAAFGGGALYLGGATASLTGCTFTSNLSYAGNQAGGAIWSGASALTVTGCTFTSNSSPVVGGAINSAAGAGGTGSLAVSSSSFTSNSAGGGGAIACNTPLTLTSSAFTGNTANQGGGALYLTDPGSAYTAKTISSSTFTGNSALYGGAIGAYISGVLTVTGCTFAANSASSRGGAASISAGTPAAPTFADCLFVDNAVTGASGDGGALHVAPYLASSGTHPTVTCVNSTFTANRAVNGGGVAVFDVAVASLANCVLYADAAPEFHFGASYTGGPVGSATVTSSDVQGGYAGPGNVDAGPRFYRAPGPGPDATWGTADDDYGDLRLLPGSPCVDAGSNAAVPAGVTTDLAGNPRTYDFPGAGAPESATVDMGAYELTQDLGALHVAAGQTVALPAGGYNFSATQVTIDPGGTLDLADDSLLIDYTGTSPLAAVRSALLAGRNGGAWNGTGIVSSAARTTANRGVGYAEAADLGLTSFAGQPVDATALLLKYAAAGDANLDGRINGDDYALADRGKAKGLGTWVFGDFDYDGAVTGTDYAILNASAAPPPAPVALTEPDAGEDSPAVPVTAVLDPAPAPPQVVAPAQRATNHAKAPAKHARATKPKSKHKVRPKPAPKPKPKPAPHAAAAAHRPARAAHSSHPVSRR